MQTVKFIYGGSQTRKLTISGRNSLILSGDTESTQFVFKFPEVYKEYTKTIIWDCYIPNAYGEITNPRYVFYDDAFTVPYEITASNAGKQISFVISFSNSNSDIVETSLPYPVYITRAFSNEKAYMTSDVLSQLTNRGFVKATYGLAIDDFSGQEVPTIMFDTLSGSSNSRFTLYLDSMPYLDTDGTIPRRFINLNEIVELYSVASKEDLDTLKEAVSPDMAIITEGDEAGDIYILTQEKVWTPIYSGSRLDTLEGDVQVLDDRVSNIEVDCKSYDAHLIDQNNPHHVTKEQVGLGNVDNTADIDKPISKWTQEALDKRATITYVDGQLALKADKTDVENIEKELENKADKSDVDDIKVKLELKADKTYVDDQLELKADLSYVDTELAKKADKDTVELELEKKVDKVDGKSLIADTLITKLEGIEDKAQVNILEVVKRNGTALDIVDKAVDIEVPTKVIELEDANEYARLDTEGLTKYYLKTKVDELIEDAKSDAKVTQDEDGITVGKTALQDASTTADGLMTKEYVLQLNTATEDIDALELRVDNIETDITELKPRVETNETNISALQLQVQTNKEDIATNKADIAINKEDIATLKTSKQDKLTAGKNITISDDNVISSITDPLEPATATTLGGVKVGAKLAITDDGVLSVSGLEIADVDKLQASLDAKQDKLSVTDGLTLADNVLSIAPKYVSGKLKGGSNIILTTNDEGVTTIDASGELASTKWGQISGDIHDQKDLVSDAVISWSSTVTYAKDAMVMYGGKIYTSLLDDNTGNIPGSSEGYWEIITSEAKTTVYSETIGNGTDRIITVKHNLDSQDVFVVLRKKSDNTFVDALVKASSANEVVFEFTTAPEAGSIVATISLGMGGIAESSGSGWEGTYRTFSAKNLWTIDLTDVDRPNRKLIVQTFDDDGVLVEGYVTQTNDSISIGFNEAIGGTALLI